MGGMELDRGSEAPDLVIGEVLGGLSLRGCGAHLKFLLQSSCEAC